MIESLPRKGLAPMKFSVIVAAYNVEPYVLIVFPLLLALGLLLLIERATN